VRLALCAAIRATRRSERGSSSFSLPIRRQRPRLADTPASSKTLLPTSPVLLRIPWSTPRPRVAGEANAHPYQGMTKRRGSSARFARTPLISPESCCYHPEGRTLRQRDTHGRHRSFDSSFTRHSVTRANAMDRRSAALV
jgi:hypothetical protein